jgi:hypothetical protein
MHKVEINEETVAKLTIELTRHIESYGATHRELIVQEALSAAMHVISYLIATTASRTDREDLVANIKRMLPDVLQRSLARGAEMEASANHAAQEIRHVH